MNNNRRKLPTFKVTLVGPKKCGKSEIIRSNYYLTIPLIHNRWDSNPEYEISYSSNNNGIANVKLCEFPMMFNQEHGLDNALINVDLYCICFSTFHVFDDNAPTECPDFAKIEKYVLPIISHHSPQTPYIVMGCMSDLRGSKILYGDALNVSSNDGIEFAKKIGALSYIESSSVVGYNINKILEMFIKSVVYRKSEPSLDPYSSSGKCFMQ